MRSFILAAALAATILPGIAVADPPRWAPAHGHRAHDNWREWHRYDHDRPDPRYRNYDARRYYRGGYHYEERRLTRDDRIYRGSDGYYYCRRSDGTTGLIVGALAGGLLGDSLDRGRSSTLGALIGAVSGALIGRAIDRGDGICR